MKTWTYRLERLPTNPGKVGEALNLLGEDGWEALSSSVAVGTLFVLLKKPGPEK